MKNRVEGFWKLTERIAHLSVIALLITLVIFPLFSQQVAEMRYRRAVRAQAIAERVWGGHKSEPATVISFETYHDSGGERAKSVVVRYPNVPDVPLPDEPVRLLLPSQFAKGKQLYLVVRPAPNRGDDYLPSEAAAYLDIWTVRPAPPDPRM